MPKSNSNGSIAVKKTKSENDKNDSKSGKNLDDLLQFEINHIFEAERNLSIFYPELIKLVSDEDLSEQLDNLFHDNKKQIQRLEKVFNKFGFAKSGNNQCVFMNAIISEVKQITKDFSEGSARDAAIIIQLQKIINHKIASYDGICNLSDILRQSRIADILDRSLAECENDDFRLSKLAEVIHSDAYDELLV